MSTERVIEIVEGHYAVSDRPLMMSDLGKKLKAEALWPIDGEKRKLVDYIESLSPPLKLLRDEETPSFAVVVPIEKASIAEKVIVARHDKAYLARLPRSVLVAFVVEPKLGSDVYLRRTPPYRYKYSDSAVDGFGVVDDEFRLPGTDVRNLSELDYERLRLLTENIREWLSKNNVVLELQEDQPKDEPPQPKKPTSTTSALERLRNAQAPGVAEQMVIPLDIALHLAQLA